MSKIKEIAVIVAGIDEEYQSDVINGIISCAHEKDINISCFAAFGGVISNRGYDEGEYRIFDLINYNALDGVILLTNTISDPVEKLKIIERVRASGIPAAVLDCDDYPEFYNIRIDNRKAMSQIVDHVINHHGAKVINYISGPTANPEAEDRYQAFLKVMADNKLIVDARRVYFGDFRAIDGKNAINAFEKYGLQLPDAIICANDAMALAAVEELEARGYKVPDDIIVTGFDNTYNARHHLPPLTSVKRPLEEAGYKACKLIADVINGEPYDNDVPLEASPVYSGSCGCAGHRTDDDDDFKRGAYKLINNCRSDISLLNRLTTELAETETVEEEFNAMRKFVNEINCDHFSICLCDNWDRPLKNEWNKNLETQKIVNGYTEKMIAPLIYDNGKYSSLDSFELTDIYPKPLSTGGNISYLLPLHFRERCLGYYIITNSDFPLKSLLCHSFLLNVSNSIENIRKLISLNSMIHELDRLYVNDPLCNIYNRNGFIRAADTLFNRCLETGEKLLISFIDMDGLKLINDNYGHKEGDFALQRLASIITDCCKNGRICARFGGDEFIIIGAGAVDEDIAALESTFRKQLESVNNVIGKPYEIEASIGTIVTGVDDEITLFNLITKADSLMYERKKRKKTSRYLRKC
ncbi:MAG: GGDEF domain-containing protein [Ruminococcus sp.]|nr:GGDEF domain-containing protein [Ruminococcus sp.]